MVRRGFTAVELIITITVMGILLIVAFVSLTTSQVRARDDERRTDIETITSHLESYYKNGSSTSTAVGVYPSADLVANEASIKAFLQNADMKSFLAPGITTVTGNFIAATNATQTETGVTPQPTIDQYVYQPLRLSGSTWATCTTTQVCRKYNLYYRLESDNTVYMVRSKNQ